MGQSKISNRHHRAVDMRCRKGLTSGEIAEVLGVTRKTVQKWFSEILQRTKLRDMYAVCFELGVEVGKKK